ncbi:MAG: hypothetical protein AAGJ46_17330 [Planctomycetota bacterium]
MVAEATSLSADARLAPQSRFNGDRWSTDNLLPSIVDRVIVGHPGHLRLIYRANNKNDRNDADRLAKLLYLG